MPCFHQVRFPLQLAVLAALALPLAFSSGCTHNVCGTGCSPGGCQVGGCNQSGGAGNCSHSGNRGLLGGCGTGNCAHGARNSADYVPHLPRQQYVQPGPPVGTYAYPYYTTRGPRDFLLNNPPSIGPY